MRKAAGLPVPVAALGVALTACGDREAGGNGNAVAPPPANDPGAQPPPPPGDDSMRWNFTRNALGPKLAYGEPATDNVRLMLRCPPGGDSVVLSFHRPRETTESQPSGMTIEAGPDIHRATVETSESRLGGMMVEAQAPVAAAPFARLRAGSPLTIRWGDVAIAVPAGGDRQGQIDAFFEACGPS